MKKKIDFFRFIQKYHVKPIHINDNLKLLYRLTIYQLLGKNQHIILKTKKKIYYQLDLTKEKVFQQFIFFAASKLKEMKNLPPEKEKT